MATYTFDVVFKAIDQMSKVIDGIGGKFERLNKWVEALGLEKIGSRMSEAGHRVLEFGEGFLDAAEETQTALANVGALTNWQTEQLDKLREAGEKFSSQYKGSTDDFIKLSAKAVPFYREENAAIEATTNAMKLQAATGIDSAGALQLGIQANRIFGDSNEKTTQQLAAAAKVFGVNNEAYARGFGRLGGIIKLTGGDSLETMALIGVATQTLGPAAGRMIGQLTPFLSKAAASGVDAVSALEQVRDALQLLPREDRVAYLKELGIAPGLESFIEQIGQVHQGMIDIVKAAPSALGEELAVKGATAQSKIAVFQNNVKNLKEAIGTQLLPIVIQVVTKFNEWITRIQGFTAAHPALTKFLVIAGAIAGVLLVVGGAILAILGPFILFGGAVASAIAAAAPFIAWGAAIAVMIYSLWDVLKAFAAFLKNWGLTILGFIVAPWAILPYEIHKHWAQIKSAALDVAHGIARFFVGHSPIPEGPLRELNLGKTITATLNPTAVMPGAMGMAGALAGMATQGGGTHIDIHLNYSLNGVTPDGFDARTNAERIARMVKDSLARDHRLQYARA